jgi:hypothetical protein
VSLAGRQNRFSLAVETVHGEVDTMLDHGTVGEGLGAR